MECYGRGEEGDVKESQVGLGIPKRRSLRILSVLSLSHFRYSMEIPGVTGLSFLIIEVLVNQKILEYCLFSFKLIFNCILGCGVKVVYYPIVSQKVRKHQP